MNNDNNCPLTGTGECSLNVDRCPIALEKNCPILKDGRKIGDLYDWEDIFNLFSDDIFKDGRGEIPSIDKREDL